MSEFTKFIANLNRNRYTRLFNRIRKEKIPCALFLSDLNFQEQMTILQELKEMEFNLQYFFTLDENLREPVAEIPTVYIKNLQDLRPEPKYVLASPGLANQFAHMFQSAGGEFLDLILNSVNPDLTFDFYMDHLNEIEEVYQDLDEDSRKVFLGFISGRASNRFTDFIFDPMPQYLLNGYMPKPNDVVICAGACDGATAAMFADLKCRVIAFEMDQYNYELSKKSAAEKNFVLENFGLGSYEHEMNYVHLADHIGASRISKDGNLTTKIVSIDEYVREKHLESVNFIQLDTEGEELEILKGAVVTMSRFKPTLAISAYHKREDIFVLAQFIKSIRPDYEFAFRHYGLDARDDLPMLFYNDTESVLYAR